MNIAVAGMGYVGLSNAVLLSQSHSVVVRDISPAKVDMLAARKSPFADTELQQWLSEKPPLGSSHHLRPLLAQIPILYAPVRH